MMNLGVDDDRVVERPDLCTDPPPRVRVADRRRAVLPVDEEGRRDQVEGGEAPLLRHRVQLLDVEHAAEGRKEVVAPRGHVVGKFSDLPPLLDALPCPVLQHDRGPHTERPLIGVEEGDDRADDVLGGVPAVAGVDLDQVCRGRPQSFTTSDLISLSFITS